MDKTTTFVLNCTPSLGVLDSWMSIVSTLKRVQPDARFVFVADPTDVLIGIEGNSLFQMADSVFDRVAFKSESGVWYGFDGFISAIESAKRTSVKVKLQRAVPAKYSQGFVSARLRKALMRMVVRPASKFLEARPFSKSKKARSSDLSEILGVSSGRAVLLFDLFQIKDGNDVVSAFDGLPKYSLLHGIEVLGLKASDYKKRQFVPDKENVIALLQSPSEVEFYQTRFDLPASALRAVGVPRHEPDWMNLILDQFSERELPFRGEKYIFVISRHCNTSYHPRERKIQGIRDILAAADRYDFRIVVKRHPKEQPDGTYEEVLGKSSYGTRWVYSDCHPFVLGKHAEFAVSFWSGVPLDVIQFGVPTIERFDLRGLPGIDNETALRDSDGHPVSAQRYLGHVLGSSDTESFMNHVESVMARRQEVVATLLSAYNRDFPRLENVNEVVAKCISN